MITSFFENCFLEHIVWMYLGKNVISYWCPVAPWGNKNYLQQFKVHMKEKLPTFWSTQLLSTGSVSDLIALIAPSLFDLDGSRKMSYVEEIIDQRELAWFCVSWSRGRHWGMATAVKLKAQDRVPGLDPSSRPAYAGRFSLLLWFWPWMVVTVVGSLV